MNDHTSSGRNRDFVAECITNARDCYQSSNYGKSYAFFLLVLKLAPQLQIPLKDEYCLCWEKWSQKLIGLHKHKELFESYRQGCEIYLDCDLFHVTMGLCLHNIDFKYGAIGMFRRAITINPHCHKARENLANTCRGLVDSWHFPMLNDIERNQKFATAIYQHLTIQRNGAINVLDIGSGTSILSMIAAKCGCSSVTACEMSNIMHMIADDIIKQNNLNHAIKLINSKSNQIEINNSNAEYSMENKAQLVVTETVDAGLFGEGIMETLDHAWKHLLTQYDDGGRVIPSHARLHCKLIQSEKIYYKHVFELNELPNCRSKHYSNLILSSSVGVLPVDKDLKGPLNKENAFVLPLVAPEPYTSERLRNIPHVDMTSAESFMHVDFNNAKWISKFVQNRSIVTVDFTAIACGYIDALVLYFSLFLDAEESIAIETDQSSSHCWEQAVYPLRNFNRQNQTVGQCGNCCQQAKQLRIIVHKNDKIKINFLTQKDNLQIDSVEIRHGNTNKSMQQLLHHNSSLNDDNLIVLTNESDVMKFNDLQTNELYTNSIKKFVSDKGEGEKIFILDIFEGLSPVFRNMCNIYKNKENIRIYKAWSNDEVFDALKSIVQHQNVTNAIILKDIPEVTNVKYDVIVADIIEPSGLLRSQVLENLAQAKMHLAPGGKVFPHSMKLFIQCIDSEELRNKCIVNDQNTLGFDIADFINDFQVVTYCNLDVDSIEYTAITSQQIALEFDFNDSNPASFVELDNTVRLPVITNGKMTAVLSWFEIRIDEENVINTIHQSNHWKQAAMITHYNQENNVTIGDILKIEASCRNSYINITVLKEKKT